MDAYIENNYLGQQWMPILEIGSHSDKLLSTSQKIKKIKNC